MFNNRRGQSTAEYAILIAVVIAAVVGMQLYVKRGMQAKFKGVSDAYSQVGGEIGGDASGTPLIDAIRTQYEPYYAADGQLTTVTNSSEQSNMALGGTLTKTGIDNTTTRDGAQTQGADTALDDVWNNSN